MLPKNGEHESWSPKNMEQELGSPKIGSRSGGWQKSWFQTALDPVLDYGSHKKSQVQIEELSLKDNRRALLGPKAN